ncbi:LysR family transcriptional regulator [Caulobacter sp. Root1455]|uniref:LysR family transcriptional regulator n=1 Tax=Caulobacter sp. Root1455 TaxID=1736465 RepID=UPI00138ED695|nr:LysR family transcriptional regulator [Caulobacter sp. Root1455]
MSDRPPPFTALRAVEAASRHRSFTSAARELQITHSAVSQSIRRLELDLGTRLFERKGGAMEPSSAALRLAQTYSEAQESLSRAMREVLGPRADAALTIAMPVVFGRLWFAGKIGRLNEALPDVEVQISTREAAEGADIALAWSPRAVKGALCELSYLPLCAPELAAKLATAQPKALLRSPLIADAADSWSLWAARWAPGAKPPRAHLLDDAAMALDAAVQGGGIVLSNVFAAESYLTSGRLAALGFEVSAGQWLTARVQALPEAADAAERFVMWLRLELRRSQALARGHGPRDEQ